MSTTTTHMGLRKPELTDPADITHLNPNWDKIDHEVGNRKIKSYSNVSELGVADITTLTSWVGVIPANSFLAISVSYSISTKMFTNGLLPADTTGGLVIFNTNLRCLALFVTDNGVVYTGGVSNLNESNIQWQQPITGLGGSLTGGLKFEPTTGEGGQIDFYAPDDKPTQNGITVDYANGKLRIFGIPSADGKTVTGTGTGLVIDPYSKTIEGGYTLFGNVKPNFIELTPPTSADNGGYIDFHYAGSTKDYTVRIIEGSEGKLKIEAPNGVVVSNPYHTSPAVRNSYAGTTDMEDGVTPLETGMVYYYYEE